MNGWRGWLIAAAVGVLAGGGGSVGISKMNGGTSQNHDHSRIENEMEEIEAEARSNERRLDTVETDIKVIKTDIGYMRGAQERILRQRTEDRDEILDAIKELEP